MNGWAKIRRWLLPTALILFLLQVILLPYAASLTYAGRSESPDNTLTYTLGSLVWDSATNIDQNGVAELNLFSASYQNVLSSNGDKVVAPGTEGHSIVRLKNDASNIIEFVAVFYSIKDEPALPVEPEMVGEGFADTESYPLPDGVEKNQVVRAVRGMLFPQEIQDFDIIWEWGYGSSDEQSRVDTALGDKAAFDTADEITAGLYIVVSEEPVSPPPPYIPGDPGDPLDPIQPETPPEPLDPNLPEQPAAGESDPQYIYPQVPQTGDTTSFSFYLVLMGISGVLLLLLLLDHRKESK